MHAATSDRRPIDLGPAKCQLVLAALALEAGQLLALSRLVELIWGDEPPRTAERTLQSYITRLRRALGDDVIVRHGGAYRLTLAPAMIDVARFEDHLDNGRIGEALADWSGPPLAGLDAPGLAPTVARLTERWLGAVETDLARQVDDDPAAAVASLTELTATHPFREGLWALLMIALYRIGRQADALAAYQTARRRLVDDLGLEPGPALQELEQLILGRDERLGGTRPAETGSGRHHPNAAADRPLPTGTVTFAVAEIEGVADGWRRGPVAMREAVARVHRLVDTLAERHGGVSIATGGDSCGAAFDRAQDAALWAVELQRATATEQPLEEAIDQPLEGATGQPLEGATDQSIDSDVSRVAIGLHTGEAEHHQGRYFGPAVNAATTLAAAAHGGQTLLSGATVALLASAEVTELGRYRLTSTAPVQPVFQLGRRRHPPPRLERPHHGNLPRQRRRLVGRTGEVQTVRAALANHPVVTLVGPGGIGKTALAVEVAAAEGHDDSWLIDLGAVSAPAAVARAVTSTLGVNDRSGQSLVRCLVDGLRDRRCLLVVDNCEHVLAAVADLVAAVVDHCPDVKVLATSRERLGVVNERIVAVPPLDPDGTAVELFDVCAAAAAPFYDPVAERGSVAGICRRLDGIPLAIELAAARVSSLTPGELLERADHQLHLPAGARSRPLARHRTVHAAIDWSYELLTPEEQRLFEQLSVFAGPFDLAAAEWVAADGATTALDVHRYVGDLVERSMLGVESGPFGRRFRFLQPIRQFGAERLDRSGTRAAVEARHAGWCQHQVAGIGTLLSGWDEPEGVARLDELWPNLRLAFDWACGTGSTQLAWSLIRPIVTEILLRTNNELGDWIERLLDLTDSGDVDARAFGLHWAAHRYTVNQNVDGYRRLAERIGEPDHLLARHGRAFVARDFAAIAASAPLLAAHLRAAGDHHLAERLAINRANALMNLGRYDDCERLGSELVQRFGRQGPPSYLNWALMVMGYAALFQGHPDRADRYFDEAIAVDLPPRTFSPNQVLEARAAFRRGNRVQAFHLLRSHVDGLLGANNMQAAAVDCVEFVNMMGAIDRHDLAEPVLRHLVASDLFNSAAWRSLVTVPIEPMLDDSPGSPSAAGDDDQQVLHHMVATLDQLLAS
ncbi:MAG: BTAD domain-containing putative transcriptional regulator [Acidimicrobiales bacterium]